MPSVVIIIKASDLGVFFLPDIALRMCDKILRIDILKEAE